MMDVSTAKPTSPGQTVMKKEANTSKQSTSRRANIPATTTSPVGSQVYNDEDEEEWFSADDVFFKEAFGIFEEIRSCGKLCDVTLVCDDTRFSAHRIVLSATVPYFRAMFTHDMMESNKPEITMQGIEPRVLEELINFAYTRKVRITSTNVQSLHIGAAFLQLKSICDACSAFLMKRLTVPNVLQIRSYATLVGADGLVAAADAFINKHFVPIKNTEEFLELTYTELSDILSRDTLHVPSEEPIFEGILAWVSADPVDRHDHMPDLLSRVRLPLLKPSYLSDRVASEELVKSNLRCRDLVDEAKDYHLMPERRSLLQSFRTKPRTCTDMPGVIYAVGGLTNSGDSLSTVEMFDPAAGRFTSIDPMATLRSRVGVAVMGRRLFAIGGFNGHDRLKTVEVFDPDAPHAHRWRQMAPLNNKRSALGAAVLGTHIYVCGGYDGISSLSSVERYDANTDKWSLVSGMNRQRSAAGIAVLDGKIFVMGGHDGMSIFNSVECFDPAVGEWIMIMPMRSRRCRLGATAFDGKIYVCGGYDGSQFLRSVECYDPELDQWLSMPDMNVKRSRVALVSNCGRLYAIGGYDGISNLSSMELMDPNSPTVAMLAEQVQAEQRDAPAANGSGGGPPDTGISGVMTTSSVGGPKAAGNSAWTFGPSMIAHEGGVGIGVIPTVPYE